MVFKEVAPRRPPVSLVPAHGRGQGGVTRAGKKFFAFLFKMPRIYSVETAWLIIPLVFHTCAFNAVFFELRLSQLTTTWEFLYIVSPNGRGSEVK
jgi:hypothetical protein